MKFEVKTNLPPRHYARGYIARDGDLVIKDCEDDDVTCITTHGYVFRTAEFDLDEAVTLIFPGDSVTITF